MKMPPIGAALSRLHLPCLSGWGNEVGLRNAGPPSNENGLKVSYRTDQKRDGSYFKEVHF